MATLTLLLRKKKLLNEYQKPPLGVIKFPSYHIEGRGGFQTRPLIPNEL
ncbi:hypothetical protein RsTz2092_07220 [Deferribacterales bacterium RsTz2092]